MPEERPIKWAPNPYAIAQLLRGSDDPQLFKASGRDADNFLRKSLLSTNNDTVSSAFRQFQILAERSDRPGPAADKIKERLVAQAVRKYGKDEVQRVLYYLLPITDAVFEAVANQPAGSVTNAVDAFFDDADALILTDASYLDPIQGYIADCYLIASMIALAWIESPAFNARLRHGGFNPPAQRSFEWKFHDTQGVEVAQATKVTGRIPVSGNIPRYARSATPAEDWPSLLEKVFVVRLRPLPVGEDEPKPAIYQSIDRGVTPQRACQMLVGGELDGAMLELQSTQQIFLSQGQQLTDAAGIVTRPVVAWTKDNADPQFWETTHLWPNHAYAVLGIMPSGHVVLRNPHGVATGTLPGWSTDPQWAPAGRDAAVPLNEAGVFGLSQPLFEQHFNNIGWVNLPPQPA